MHKFKKVFNGASAIIILFSMIFVLSFVTNRINEFNMKKKAVKTNISYVTPNSPVKERYEQKITDKAYIKTYDDSENSIKDSNTSVIKKEFSFEHLKNGIINSFSGSKLIFSEETQDYRTHNCVDIKTMEEIPFITDCTVKEIKTESQTVVLSDKTGNIITYQGIIPDEALMQDAEYKTGDTVGLSLAENDYIFSISVVKDGIFLNPTEFFN